MTSATDNRTTERIDHPPRVREAIDELMRKKDVTDNRATELLHKLLIARGVEFDTDIDECCYDEPPKTTWDFVLCGLEMTVTATEFVDVDGKKYLEMDFHHAFTPEQAIAATLGSGTLTAEQVREAIRKYAEDDSCHIFEVYGEMCGLIADELNAMLGGGKPTTDVAEKVEDLRLASLKFPPNIRRKVNIALNGIEQAIAVALGSGTCENIAPDYLDFLCSKCGFVHYHSDENDTGDGNDWNHCPNCGRKVVSA